MFQENLKHLQRGLLNTVAMLPKHIKDLLQKSWAEVFYKRIFCQIDERKFSVLFSRKKSRPNFPINIYVGLEILKQLFNWSDEEMISNFHLNFQVCYALGIENFGEITLAPRTIYYNRKRIIDYEEKNGVNLFEDVFRQITLDEIKALGIDASVQRMDSSLISSNIKKMSRLELAIKVLQNFYGDLPEQERNRHYEMVKDYVDWDADSITFKLKNTELDQQLSRVGELLLYFRTLYQDSEGIKVWRSFRHVSRVLDEQFTIQADGDSVSLRAPQEMGSSCLQNPADEKVTYRRKNNEDHQGYAFNVSETCSKENKTQPLTDVSPHINNTSDERILKQRIAGIKQRTGVKEMVTDDNFSGEESEKACEQQGVEVGFTGIKGAKLSSEHLGLHDFHLHENGIEFCPQGHKSISKDYNPITGRWVVHFDKERCSSYPLRERCCVQERKRFTTLCFTDRQLRVARRRQQFTEEEYRVKQKLRPAVEGTISLFKRKTHKGKLSVGGFRRAKNVVILTALAINSVEWRRLLVGFFVFYSIPKMKSSVKSTKRLQNLCKEPSWPSLLRKDLSYVGITSFWRRAMCDF